MEGEEKRKVRAGKGGEGKVDRGGEGREGRRGPRIQPPPWALQNLGPALGIIS